MKFLLENYFILLYSWVVLSLIVFLILISSKTAKYGRHYTPGSKVQIDNRMGWIIMEIPALVLLPLYFIFGPNEMNLMAWIYLGLFVIHYINRTLIFPFRLKTEGKKMPLHIVLSAIFFNVINTFFLGYYFGFMPQAQSNWISNPVFIIGVIIFFIGMTINIRSDNILLKLRNSAEPNKYKIPEGGLFNWISCPNYLGELIEWLGYAILTMSLSTLAFALWTFANLIPRARDNHRWYLERFSEYPQERKAIIPFLL